MSEKRRLMRKETGRSVWSTGFIFVILFLMTIAMAVALRAMVTGSMGGADAGIESRAGR